MNKQLYYKSFLAVFISISIGFLTGIGMFFSQIVFLERSVNQGFFWAFVISPTLSMAYLISKVQNIRYKYYDEDDN